MEFANKKANYNTVDVNAVGSQQQAAGSRQSPGPVRGEPCVRPLVINKGVCRREKLI